MIHITRDHDNKLSFTNYLNCPDNLQDFNPNLTPREVFKMGSFGGTYWRPINSSVTRQKYENIHNTYPAEWWDGVSEDYLSSPWSDYNKNINCYGVKVGSTLEEWEEKDWITKHNPYGWMHWYCDFYLACSIGGDLLKNRSKQEDERQINRWIRTAGPKSRFRRALINLISKMKGKYDDYKISPKKRQTLQHWAYILTKKDFIET